MAEQRNGGARSAENNGAQGGQTTALATTSERFVVEVQRQFTAQMGTGLAWTDYQRTLAQHLFLRVDAQLKALEAKRLDDDRGGAPITWENVNMQKLALDGVHRVSLGLDALIPNHIHPIPYWNKRIQKYDLDLRIGYSGKLFCRQELAVEKPVEVICELVYDSDTFVPHVRSRDNEIESYEFKINQPFTRGEVIGGFGYIVYEDPKKNRLILVTMRDFQRAEAGAKTKDFWGHNKSRIEMMYKTVVHRVADKIPLDPRKVNAPSYAYIEAQEAEGDIEREVASEGNRDVIDVSDYTVSGDAPDGAKAPPAAQEPEPAPPTEDKPQREPEAVGAQATLAGPGF